MAGAAGTTVDDGAATTAVLSLTFSLSAPHLSTLNSALHSAQGGDVIGQ